MSEALSHLAYFMKNGVDNSDLTKIQDIECLLTEKGYEHGGRSIQESIQTKYDYFTNYFQSQGRLRINTEEKNSQFYQPKQQYYSNKEQRSENSLRFSFENDYRENKRPPFGFRNGPINTLEEAP